VHSSSVRSVPGPELLIRLPATSVRPMKSMCQRTASEVDALGGRNPGQTHRH
jgi:hypothetical protein